MIVGIDPGKNGAAAFLEDSGEIVALVEFSKHTEHEIANVFLDYLSLVKKAYIEIVSPHPKEGVHSVFVFGTNFGFWLGLLTALKIPYEKVSPVKWQRALGSLTQGDKKITKRKAQQLYPNQSINHATADAILIAEYGRRVTP